MGKQLQKLELTWIGKGSEPRLEPRILIEDVNKRFGDIDSGNMLIQGDNLLALKAIEQQYAGVIKCVCIDPPYNTGSAFEQYDDGIEHSIWLNLMNDRIKLIHKLLSSDGTLWIAIDDNEAHYLKVLCDQIFGRQNFIANIVWEKSDSPRMDAVYFSSRHDYILCYAKNKEKVTFNREKEGQHSDHYDKIDKNTGKAYYLKPLRAMGGEDRKEDRPSMHFPIIAPDGTKVLPKRQDGSDGRWRWGQDKIDLERDRIDFVKGKNGWSIYYRIYAESSVIKPPETIWKHEEVGSNRTSKAEIKAIFGSKAFDTPKPEKLIQKIISLSTNENDYVLDSFLGSGTTAAVAHKMKRKWIGIELGDHAVTHCLPRLQKVVKGEDSGGISEAVNWKGGGGFKFYTLAPSLIKKDKYGSDIINTFYDANLLAAAMAKQEGFRYSPDESKYWKQGLSSEKDFIFTTTQFVTTQILDKLADELKPGESLLICCKSFAKGCTTRHKNITIKKIPQMLLGRCEFGKDDYSLNIIRPRGSEDESDETEDVITFGHKEKSVKSRKKSADEDTQQTLF